MSPRRGDNGAALALFSALLLMSVHVAGRAVRDTLFLSNFPVTFLPRVMIAAAVASLLGAVLMSRLLVRVSPAGLIPGALVASGLLFVVEWILVRSVPGTAAVAVYLHLAALSMALLSGFWSVVNERFDPYTAKGVVTRAGGFGALGGVLGGLAAILVAPRLGVSQLLLGFGAVHAGAGLAIFALGRPVTGARPSADSIAEVRSGLSIVRRTPLLLRMAALVVLVAVTEELLDYAFKVAAVEQFQGETALVRFFALFYTAANVLAFGLQTGLGERALRVLGIGGTLALLPAAVALTGSAAAFLGRLWAVSLARAANAVLTVSFFRASFELLWTPLPRETKRPAKAYIDLGAKSLGDILGGGLILVLLLVVTDLPNAIVLALVAVFSIGSMLLISQLHRHYVLQLADNLRAGVVTLSQEQVVDATTERTLTDTRVTIDRAELQARLKELDRMQAEIAPASAEPDAPVGTTRDGSLEALLENVGAFGSGEAAAIRVALERGSGDPRLVGHVLPLLERPDLLDDVLGFLRDLAPRSVGQLTDALRDPEQDVLIRRRVPRALEACASERALQGLSEGLEDPDFDVRLECARAAVRAISGGEALRLPRQRVLSVVERELALDARTWEQNGRRRHQAATDESALLEPSDLPRVDRSVEYVFSVLALAWGAEVMASTLKALYAADAHLRGTALEYLQTVLPDRVRAALWPRIPGGAPHTPSRRPAEAIAEELLLSSPALPGAPGRRRDLRALLRRPKPED